MNSSRSRNRFRNVSFTDQQLEQRVDFSSRTTIQQRTTTEFERKNRRSIRSQEIMEAVRNLDQTQDDAYRHELIKWLEDAYAERMSGILLGLFSRCYLGHPYVDHQLSIHNRIIEHYTRTQTPPPPYDNARPLIRSGAYEFVEVYSDGEIIPIAADGTPR